LLRAGLTLQQANGGTSFFLTYDAAAQLLGVSKPTAQLDFRRLIGAGFLERLTTGNNYAGRASEYQVRTDT
jgi:hypothetical protein